jgi:hypothetical protein
MDDAVAQARRDIDDALRLGGLGQLAVTPSRREGARFTLRWIMLHMIEEYARHNGHADLIRESIDGATGE